MRIRLRSATAVVLLFLAARARAEDDELVRIEVHVTAVTTAGAYLDLGSDAGLAAGDRVELFPDGKPMVEAVVRTVSRQSARADWIGIATGVVPGVRGEAVVPRARLGTQGAQGSGGGVQHPPWTQPIEGWDPERPLLAPGALPPQAELESPVTGRLYQGLDSIRDHEIDRTYLLSRTGADLLWENPFGRQGELGIEAELFHRVTDLPGSDDQETELRLERLSYARGGTEDEPARVEAGRFLQYGFPELGVIDGVEGSVVSGDGSRWGASLGFLPDWSPEMRTGDNPQVALWWRRAFGEDQRASLGAGVQKTWHEGEADRDLVLLDGAWKSESSLWLRSTAWIDYYTGADDLKDPGFQLSQLVVSATQIFDSGAGLGAFASYLRWPQTLHSDFDALPQQITDGELARLGLNGWRDVAERVRLSGRVDGWTDEDDSGGGGEVRAAWREVLWGEGEVAAAVFLTDGSYTDYSGLRLSALRPTGAGLWTLNYEVADAARDDGSGSDESLVQQLVRGSWDGRIGKGWTLSVYLEERFGDEQGSLAAGFLLQRNY